MANTPVQGWPVPSGSQGPATAADFAALGGAAELGSVMRFATASARDTAVPALSRKAGMIARVAAEALPKMVDVDTGTFKSFIPDLTFRTGQPSAITGTTPAVGGLLEIRAASQTLTTDGSGGAHITFYGGAFTGLMTIFAMPGDASGSVVLVRPYAYTTSGFDAVCFNSSWAVVASTSVRVNWFALGWV